MHWVGTSGTALNWFLSNRKFCVSINNFKSYFSHVKYGVQQGSILGPILFSLYMLPLREDIRRHGISFHCYADDTQLYLPVRPSDIDALSSVQDCIYDIRNWMSINFLQLISNKTEILVSGSQQFTKQILPPSGFLSPFIKPIAKNLGVLFDSGLKFDQHVTKLV